MSISYRLKRSWLFATSIFRKTYTGNVCGHETKQTGEVIAAGGRSIFSMPLAENGSPDFCLACIGKMSIQCAWCEEPIDIGDPITLLLPKDPSKPRPHATKYEENGKCFLVGCLGWDCAFSGGERAGFWMPPGKVQRVPTVFEMLLSAPPDHALVIKNLSDPNDRGELIPITPRIKSG